MKLQRYRDLIVALIFLVGSVVYYILSLSIPQAGLSKMGPEFVPQVVADITFLLSIILLVSSIRQLNTTAYMSKARNRGPDEDEADTRASPNYLPVVLTLILLFLFIQLLDVVGFVLASAGYLFLQFNVSAPVTRRGLRYQVWYAGGALLAGFAINGLFVNLFNVMLPQGLLG